MGKDKNELLYTDVSPNIEQLFEIYRKDRYHARVYYMNSIRSDFGKVELRKFGTGKKYDLVLFHRKFGISKTNVIYSNEKVELRIRVRKTGVWVCRGKTIRAFTLEDLHSISYFNEDFEISKISKHIKGCLIKTFPWIEYVDEGLHITSRRALNYYIGRKLFTKRKIVKDVYGFEWPISNMLHELDLGQALFSRTQMVNFQHYRSWMTNENKFNKELIVKNWGLFYDTLKMAKALDKKVNLAWGINRLKEEHGKLGKELTDIVFLYDESELNNSLVYKDFAKWSHYTLLSTVKELAIEGIEKYHCVATYKGDVNNGLCGIYSIGDYTLELRFNTNANPTMVYMSQFKGWDNKRAPDDERAKVQMTIDLFNKNVLPKKLDEYLVERKVNFSYHGDEFPF